MSSFPDIQIMEVHDLLKASESSLDFWNNEIDDEVWVNV